jgi:excisionase family DNA binding protein
MAVIDQGAPLAYSVKEACRLTSLGRTRIFQLISEKKLEARKVGRRTLIPAASLHKLLEGDRDAA